MAYAKEKTGERRDRRIPLSRPVFFASEDVSMYDFRYHAISVNVSKCGMCIFTDRPIDEGQEISFVSKYLWPDEKSGRAVWSQRLSDNLFKTGFAFC
jgi:hypothetical protein